MIYFIYAVKISIHFRFKKEQEKLGYDEHVSCFILFYNFVID